MFKNRKLMPTPLCNKMTYYIDIVFARFEICKIYKAIYLTVSEINIEMNCCVSNSKEKIPSLHFV